MLSSCDCSDEVVKDLQTLHFVFLQPLFRCLLTAPAPAVRRHTLQRILRFGSKLSSKCYFICDRNFIALPLEAVVLRWFCSDVISVLDNPAYFVNVSLITDEESQLLDRLESQELSMDTIFNNDAVVSEIVTSNPGLQLHVYFTQLLLRLHLQRPNLIPYFIHLLCSSISGSDTLSSMKSFSALKWMLRPLTFAVVRDLLIGYKVIDGAAFMKLKSYIEVLFCNVTATSFSVE